MEGEHAGEDSGHKAPNRNCLEARHNEKAIITLKSYSFNKIHRAILSKINSLEQNTAARRQSSQAINGRPGKTTRTHSTVKRRRHGPNG